MNYFVIGVIGFIGCFLVVCLFKCEGVCVFVLVWLGLEYKLDVMCWWLCVEESCLVLIIGDLIKKLFGVSKCDQDDLVGQIDYFFYFVVIYDLSVDENIQCYINIEGIW